uniref:Ribonuclease 3 n=1 Tax=uncultured bacterium UPO53 TaxID=1776978 RepID=A0A126SYD7_9BACT|nr:ribonuclease III [uncultured bacterium UPO53]
MQTLGHEFHDLAWLELALTHRSVSGSRNNERLEFLGDAILNFVVADFLYQSFPAEKEGSLSRLRALLVKQETLAGVARDLQLGDFLRLGPGELKSGGFRRESILADTVEAVLGAIYRDTGDMGYCACRVQDWFGERLGAVGQETVLKDSKSRLQEFLQGRRLPLPAYAVTGVTGEAHNQTFQVSCEVPGLPAPTQGQGPSRRHAEQEAAASALRQLGLQDSDE